MALQTDETVLILKINADAAGASVTEMTARIKELTNALYNMHQADNPQLYNSMRTQLGALIAAQEAEKASIIDTTQALKQVNAGMQEAQAQTTLFGAAINRATDLSAIGARVVNMFSRQIIGLGVGMLSVTIGAKAIEALAKWVLQLKMFNPAASEAKLKMDAMNAAFASSDYTGAIGNIEQLTEDIKLAKNGFLDKTKVLKEYNDKLGATMGYTHNLDVAEQNIVKHGDAYIKMTLYKASAQLALQSATKAMYEAAQIAAMPTKDAEGDVDMGTDLVTTPEKHKAALKKMQDDEVAEKQKSADLQLKIFNDFRTQAAKIAKENKLDFFDGTEDPEKGKKAKSARDKQAKELEQYQNQLRQVHDQVDQLISGATKGTIEGLDQQLKIIDDKYKALIAKLQELNKNKNATSADKANNNKQISELKISDTADQLLATNDADYNNDSKVVKNEYADKQNELKDQYAKNLLTKQEFEDKSYKLEQEGLEKLYMLEITYGMSTEATETKLANNTIANKKRVADAAAAYLKLQLTVEKDFLKSKQDIEAAKEKLATDGFSVLNEIFGKNKALMLAELAVEDFISIGKIKAAEGVEIASYFAKYALVPGGELIAAGLAAAAETRTDLLIADVLVASIGKAIGGLSSGGSSKKMAKGGLVDGPGHSAGGVPLINGHTGKQMAEVEGGETVAVFSKETTANNGMLINQLLYNSQHRNGAPVTIDTGTAVKAMERYRTGGIIPGFGNSAAGSSGQSSPGGSTDRLDRIEQVMHDFITKQAVINEIPVTFNNRAYDIQKARNVKVQNNANA